MEISRMMRHTTALTLGLALLGAAGAFAGSCFAADDARRAGLWDALFLSYKRLMIRYDRIVW